MTFPTPFAAKFLHAPADVSSVYMLVRRCGRVKDDHPATALVLSLVKEVA